MARQEQIDTEALRRSMARLTNCVDLVYATAVGAVRIAELEGEDLPRICISAGCRSLEMLIEKHQQVMAGAFPLQRHEVANLRKTIIAAATDLKDAIDMARKSADALVEYSKKLQHEAPPSTEN